MGEFDEIEQIAVDKPERKRGKRGGKNQAKLPSDAVKPVIVDEVEVAPVKKTRRGRRGGKQVKQDSALDANASADAATVVEQVTAPSSNLSNTVGKSSNQEKYNKRVKSNQNRNAPQNHRELPELNPEVRDYFINLEKKLDAPEFDEEDQEDREIFIRNLFKELEGNEVAMMVDFDGSRILEKLLPLSNDFQLRVFATRFTGNFSALFTHQFGSHVCQSFLYLASDIIHREEIGESFVEIDNELADAAEEDKLPTMSQSIISMCQEFKNEWPSLMIDQYASHLLRVILNVLSGSPHNESIRSKKSQHFKEKNSAAIVDMGSKKRNVPTAFKEILNEISCSLLEKLTAREVKQLAVNTVANPVLQMLVTLNGTDQAIVKTLLEDTTSNGSTSFINILMKDRVGSHLMEKIIESASDELMQQLFENHFKGKLSALVLDPMANYVIQKMIANVNGAKQLELIVNELYDDFKSMIWTRAGVVEKIIAACGHHQVCMKEVFDGLLKALDINTKEERQNMFFCIICLVNPKSIGNLNGAKSCNLQGSLILQHFLNKFPISIIGELEQSIISLPKDLLMDLSQHQVSSRAIESFFQSNHIQMQSKWTLTEKLSQSFVELSKNRFGCHLVDKIWSCCDLKLKQSIANELLVEQASLEANFYGRIIIRNCQIDNFKKKKEDWVGKETAVERKMKLFADIFDDDATAVVEKEEKVKVNKPKEKKRKREVVDDNGDLGDILNVISQSSNAKKPKKAKKNKN